MSFRQTTLSRSIGGGFFAFLSNMKRAMFVWPKLGSGNGKLPYVFDLDGTIVFQGKPISKAIVKAIKELERRGHEIIFASVRPICDMLPVIDESLYHPFAYDWRQRFHHRVAR